jgi:NTP pyrophosphatase (non-canonical NTP hydrolase)
MHTRETIMTTKGLNELRDEAHRIAREHGFKDATIGEDFMLMVSEIAEALEDHRAGYGPAEVWYLEDGPGRSRYHQPTLGTKPCGIPSEMADVVIRVLHFCGKHGIDIEAAVLEKMTYNESRPMKHGGKTL